MTQHNVFSMRDRATSWRQPGSAHVVLVLPGFLACDLSTVVLRAYLGHRGYRALPWGFGQNRGPVDGLLRQLVDRVRAQASASRSPVSLIGHSLGGIYAREIAKAAPDCVRMVMTLASPFRSTSEQGARRAVVRLIERATRKPIAALLGEGACGGIAAAPPVPTVAFYSRSDRIVDWHSCMEEESPLAENVEVHTSHQRMVVSASVFRHIARRLDARTGTGRPGADGAMFASSVFTPVCGDAVVA